MTSPIALIGRTLDGLVHVSAVGDPFAALRHRSFIASHLVAGLAALAVFPVWLALSGRLTLAEAALFAWLAAPIANAALLSRTGWYEAAHLASAAALAGLIAWVAALTGGTASAALAWLVIVPFEAALSESRRTVLAATAVAALAWASVATAQAAGLLPAPLAGLPAPVFLIAGVVYAGGVAIRAGSIFRHGLVAARSGEERFRQLADNVSDMITRHGADGSVEFASPAARSLIGLPPSALTGAGLADQVHVADRPAYLKALSDAAHGRAPITVEFRLLSRRSEEPARNDYVTVEMRCKPALDAGGRTTAVIAVTRDIGAQKSHEQALRAANEETERASLAKTQFLARMSHELRTPLNAIIGFSEILETDAIGALTLERRRDYARLIRVSGEHLLQVVNGILDMSKIESGAFAIRLEPMSLAPIVDAVVEMLAPQAVLRGLTVRKSLPPALPLVPADPLALRQILINLVSNAVKFTDRGGSVTVGARVEGKALALFVADTGIGIAESDLPRLCTPFVQADSGYDRRYDGSGLGLSVVKGLTDLHGGRLAIDSRLGNGTTVTVRLPIDNDRQAPATGAAADRDMSASTETERVLKRA